MDFTQLSQRADTIQTQAGEIIRNYQSIYDSLNIIYEVLSRAVDQTRLKNLNDLIDEYYNLIQEVDRAYGEGASGVIRYIERTKANLDLLTSNLKATLNMLNTAVDSIQI